MKIEELAVAVIDACTIVEVDYMITGAFAFNLYGIPRTTSDVDLVLSVKQTDAIERVVMQLSPIVLFDPQIQFDTLTWGRRRVGSSRENPPLKVELFELFDDPFVIAQFNRRRVMFSSQLRRECSFPTPEDVVVQKLRWGRNKDLDDARDVLAVQDPTNLDMEYIRRWCAEHKTIDLLQDALASIPPQ